MNDCCVDLANRDEPEHVTEDLSFTRCRVCGARHFELELDEALLVSEVDGL